MKGFEATTVDEISAEAKVGLSTFYYHFPGKDDLLQQLAQLTAVAVEEDTLAQPEGDLATQLDRFVTSLVRRVTAVPREIVVATVGRSLPQIGGLGAGSATGPVNFSRTLDRLFQEAVSTGALPPGADHVELSAIFTGMVMEGILRWALGTASSDELGSVLRFRVDVLLSGVGRPPETT